MQHWRSGRPQGAGPVHWLRMLWGTAGDGNPLRRAIDRVEAAVMLGLVAAFLVGAPIAAVGAAQVTGAAATAELHAQRSWLQRSATLMQPGSEGLTGMYGEWDTSWVKVQWTMPGGSVRTGLVAVEENAKKGLHVPVWVTPSGQLTHPPLTRADVTDRVVTAAALAPALLGVLLLIAGDVVRVVANRRRMADWARAWEVAGPKWTSLR
jgi:hypothetical protein